jgi:hypothetical protein
MKEARILEEEAAQRIVDQLIEVVLQRLPSWGQDYVEECYDDLEGMDYREADANLRALRTAYNSRYPDLQARFDKGERGDVESELKIIDDQVRFLVALQLGRWIANAVTRPATASL